jgi:hypothetical protein
MTAACSVSDGTFFLANATTCNIPSWTVHRDKGHFGFQAEKDREKKAFCDGIFF